MGALQQKSYKYISVKFLLDVGILLYTILGSLLPTTRWSRYLGKGDDTLNTTLPLAPMILQTNVCKPTHTADRRPTFLVFSENTSPYLQK